MGAKQSQDDRVWKENEELRRENARLKELSLENERSRTSNHTANEDEDKTKVMIDETNVGVLVTMDDQEIERILLKSIHDRSNVRTHEFAREHKQDALKIIGIMKSLQAQNMVCAEEETKKTTVLTEEAKKYKISGSPEVRAFEIVYERGSDGVPLAEFKALEKEISEVGFKQAMQQKWLQMDKETNCVVTKMTDRVEDLTKKYLEMIDCGNSDLVPPKELDNLVKKRKLCKIEQWKEYEIKKGEEFALERKKLEHDLTKEMLANGSWKTSAFKQYTLVPGAGNIPASGHVHPLLKVRRAFREIFLQMGFSEMPTNNFVESGFWNFDTLIQPQQHPARDAHDTFFMKTPEKAIFAPEDYVEKVKKMHEVGGHGSVGHNYAWKREEADKNILRTHTTAVSARMLHKLAKDGFKPCKMFSIDRVFRNEAVDRTHLAEFHQVEGVVCDVGLTLGDLIGVIRQFFAELGMTQVRFKPAFNPYTEPSMEIFAFHPMLGKWVEVGNSGMFRPEMLLPMGLPEDVNVIAWGLSLERPTMIMFGIDNIRDLFGSKMQLSSVKNNQLCPLGLAK